MCLLHFLFAVTTLNVTLSSDNNPGDFGDIGDLRYSLNTMNQNLNGAPDDYEIVFAMPMTIQLNGLLPIINNSPNPVNITIGNPGSIPTVTIDGNSGSFSGFFIPTGNVTIQNMNFQNLSAKGGNGGDGISGGGGGMGAGGAIYAPQTFLNGSNPSITLMNVSINNCSAIGGNGGSYNLPFPTGEEGGGGGGGFSGNGGSITTAIPGGTGGGGGGGFGGNGGDVTQSTGHPAGGGGGGGGGIGSRASSGNNLGNGGSDQSSGEDGNGYGLPITAGSGGGGNVGGVNAGGGGGGNAVGSAGGGGGGSSGFAGQQALGSIPPGGSVSSSGGSGGDGGGGGGGSLVFTGITNNVDGKAGSGGYGGGGGGGSGLGALDLNYAVQGGTGGVGGGGGGGGVISSSSAAEGGNSLGGGGGGGGGPSDGSSAPGGSDVGALGGGSGGLGSSSFGFGFGGGGGGGGSGLGGAIFVDSGLNLTIQAFSGIPTTFRTVNNTTQAGSAGLGGPGGTDGTPGSSLGDSIFLRSGSSLSLVAQDASDLLILESVSFVDDTAFGAGITSVFVSGNGTVVYNGTTDYQGAVTINNANFKVNGLIDNASIAVCRNIGFSQQRGTLSGSGILTGTVFVNSGTIFPDPGETLTLGSLTLSPADPLNNTLGSLVHTTINSSGASLVAVSGSVTLAGVLEIDIDTTAVPGTYTLLTSSSITGTFDSVEFTNGIPNYSLSYLPTFVQFELLDPPTPPSPPTPPPPSYPTLSTQGLRGNSLKVANYLNLLAPEADTFGLTEQLDLLSALSSSQYQEALQTISPARNSTSTFAAQNLLFMLSATVTTHFTQGRFAQGQNQYTQDTAYLADNESPRSLMYAPPPNRNSQIWGTAFGQFGRQDSQDQSPAFDLSGGGFFAAYDYGNIEKGCIGALAGYSYVSIHADQSMGKGHLSSGYMSVYGMRTFSHFFIDAAVWGQYMSVDQQRNIFYPGFDETAKSSFHAGQLDLHLGTGYDFDLRGGTIEPFGMVDWVSEWDPSYEEKGASPYNMHISSRHSSMLRFETGLNGYKINTYSWGIFIAQGKLSYVYKNPNNVGRLNAAIVGAPISFVVESFTADQSLISTALELFWQTNSHIFGSVSYNGEFGSGYSSNQFYAKIGYSF